MNRLFIFLALVLVLFNFVTEAEQPIRICVILPLSGDSQNLGNAFRNGVELALADLSMEQRQQLKIEYEDDGMDPKKTLSAFHKFLIAGKIDLLITYTSATSNAVAPLAEKNKITMLAIASDTDISKNRQYVFNFWVTPEEEARVTFAEVQRRGYKNITQITTAHNGALAVRNAFNEIKGQHSVNLSEEYPLDVKDFRTYITKLKALKPQPEAVMVALFPGQISVFARQLRDSGYQGEIFGWELFEDLDEVRASNGALIGSWYVNARDANADFNKKYTQKYGDVSNYSAGNGYDAVMLSLKALSEGYRNNLNKFYSGFKDYQGVLGRYSAVSDNLFSLPVTVKTVTKDGFENLVR